MIISFIIYTYPNINVRAMGQPLTQVVALDA
jgi:hypothetical protein